MPTPSSIIPLERRVFLQGTLASSLALSLARIGRGNQQAAPRILLRSSWQTVNIGDIAHTPGVLAILEKHFPEAEVRLWASSVADGVEEMLKARFPKVAIVQSKSDLNKAFQECDFLLHGSGPSLVAQKDVERWSKETKKPYGIYGITLPLVGSADTKATPDDVFSKTIEVINGASFAYFRDSKSLALAKERGGTCPVMDFGPDGAFGTDLRDDKKAEAFMNEHRLEEGKFLCCIPRLRYTPYWLITSKNRPFDETKHRRNEEMKEHDHVPLREAIIRVVRETGMNVLICPEDQTQMTVGKEMLFDKLPADVQSRVVHRTNYWLTDEALSTYVKSAGLFGNEMHSPIMCIGNGVPAIVCRWKEQTTKGFMWQDIGLSEWLFDFDNEEDVKRMPEAVLQIAKHPEASKTKALKAQAFVQQRQIESMKILRASVNAS